MRGWRRLGRVLVVACVLPAAGCAGTLPPRVEVLQARVTPEGLPARTLDVVLCVSNPNDRALRFRSISFVLDVEGERLATGTDPDPVTLPARAATAVPFSVSLAVENLARQFVRALGDGAVTWTVSGTASPEGFPFVPVGYRLSGTVPALAIAEHAMRAIGRAEVPSACAGAAAELRG